MAVGRARVSPAAWIAVCVGAAIVLAPLLWTLLLSLKANSELMRDSGTAFSAPYTLENYRSILHGNMVFRWLLNSVVVSTGTTLGVLALCSLAGYGFARLDFPLRRTLFVFVLLGLAIPEQAVILPQHRLFAELGLHNSYPGLILPGLAGPFGVFFMTQYFRAIPRDLDEAAMLDGASRLRTFWQVLLPQTLPAQATLGVFTFLASWNSYWWPLISATRGDMFTLTVGFLMAQAVFASIPIFIVYILFQKHIVRAMGGAAAK
jgi:multiple sugar transport system permease protein